MIVCISMIVVLMLASCGRYVEQPTAQQKKYTEDSSVCAALAQQLTQNPAAYEECMTGRGWAQGPARRL
jgi:hypothetical protein